ncbi:ParB/RepB/Spo0J family partition protein [Oscillibacter ruminantium]|uniref:ParB/RepB/Spo0J family partition protein n=1 Tax=Oscillibacter ruminantium TaxID=1263547 RepID=UPI0002F1479E|nr:ParB/RepB/Spo0J family partition protein [Oscillibacter ruminantium]
MADEKLNTATQETVIPEAPATDAPEEIPAPNLTHAEAITLEKEGEALPDPGEAVIPPPVEEMDFVGVGGTEKGDPAAEDARQEWEKPIADIEAEQKKPKRGRVEKAEKETPDEEKAAKPRKNRPAKAAKAALGDAQPQVRDKVSRSKKAAPVKNTPAPKEDIPTPEEPVIPPRPVEDGQLVYLKLSELHAFHTFREHPYKVTDDEKMTELVGTIKERGVMTPATVRPEKDGNGYEIIAGHRRHHGSGLAGLEEMPCIVRNMTDIESVQEMKISNKQRGDPLPSELARLLDLEVEAIKHQGGRLDGVAEGDVGKRSVEIVGENNGMNYKKVMRYIRINSLVPELADMADAKKLGFMPAVELSYLKPKNQRLVAVSIEGEQSSPSLSQAQEMRKLDKEGRLNGDAIDGILSKQKKEVDKVIISTAELNNYFGKDKTPREMKDQILALLDDWKSKQAPELGKPEKKADLEK